jgi:uncharacterized linocin/CFP29 family protein
LKIDYAKTPTVDALLHKIYDHIRSQVAANSYGEEWILRHETGEPFYLLGAIRAQLFDKPRDDRSLGEVGMKPGMKFEVERHKESFLYVNLDPKAAENPKNIKPITYEDVHSVDGLLSMIGKLVVPTQSSTTYGDKWSLYNPASGETLQGIGPEYAKCNTLEKDGRSLAAAGIAKNVRLKVEFEKAYLGTIDTAQPEISRREPPAGPPLPKFGERDQVWDKQIWEDMDEAVRSVMDAVCVARKVFPSTIVNADLPSVYLSTLNPQDLTMEHEFRPFAEIAVRFVLGQSEVDDGKSQRTGRRFAIAAAISVARAEDALLFLGPSAIPFLNAHGVKIMKGDDVLPPGFVAAARNYPAIPIVNATASYVGDMHTALASGMASLNARAQPGPYALFLSPNRYAQTFSQPASGLLRTPLESIHSVTGGLYSVNMLPEDSAIMVSLGGEPIRIVLGTDATTGFIDRDAQGGYHFRVFEPIQCEVRDARAFQCLHFA